MDGLADHKPKTVQLCLKRRRAFTYIQRFRVIETLFFVLLFTFNT